MKHRLPSNLVTKIRHAGIWLHQVINACIPESNDLAALGRITVFAGVSECSWWLLHAVYEYLGFPTPSPFAHVHLAIVAAACITSAYRDLAGHGRADFPPGGVSAEVRDQSDGYWRLRMKRRLKELESENTRLKKLLAEAMLENEANREALKKEW